MNRRPFLSVALTALFCVAVATPALAQGGFQAGLKSVGSVGYNTKGNPTDLTVVVGTIINVVISTLGLVLFAYMVYGGFLWMTAQGDETKVKKARDLLKNAITGIVIVAAAYAISSYVLGKLETVTGGTSGGSAPTEYEQQPGNVPKNAVPPV